MLVAVSILTFDNGALI